MTEQISKKMSRNGLSVRELAERTGLSTNTIIRHTSEPREIYISRIEERRQKIVDLRSQGLTMRAIAEKLDVGVGTVHRAIQHVSKHQPPTANS